MKLIFLICSAVLTLLFLSFFWIGWRPSSPSFGPQRNTDVQASPREIEVLCAQAQMAIQDIRRNDRCEVIYGKLLKTYGQPMAATLEKACLDGRLIVTDNLVFFPAKSLCGREHLPSPCNALCGQWRSKNEK